MQLMYRVIIVDRLDDREVKAKTRWYNTYLEACQHGEKLINQWNKNGNERYEMEDEVR